jgi:hypothetical protein
VDETYRPSVMSELLRVGTTEIRSVYGPERSVVAFGTEVGTDDGMVMLMVKGSVGVVTFGAPGVTLLGLSQAVSKSHQLLISLMEGQKTVTLFVSSSNFSLSSDVVMLFTRSAVPMSPPLPVLKPQPRFGLLASPILLAAALMTVLISVRSCTAGGAAATVGRRTMPERSIVVSSAWTWVWTENMS